MITGLRFENLRISTARRGISLDGGDISHVEVTDCSFDVLGEAVTVTMFDGDMSDLTVARTESMQTDTLVRSAPINAFELTNLTVVDNTMTDSVIHDTWLNPINLRNVSDVRIANNHVEGVASDNGVGIVIAHTLEGANNIEITGNFVSNFSNGISLRNDGNRNFENVTINNNIVTNSTRAIKIDVNNMSETSTTSLFEHNTLFANTRSFEIADDSTGFSIQNNWSAPNADGFHFYLSGTASFTSDFNLFTAGEMRIGTMFVDIPTWITQHGYDASSQVESVPRFTSPSPELPRDFIPLSNSAAIDAANTSVITTDFGDRPRSNNDIGAWERQPTD